jgi:hypothetical protein
MTCPSPFCGPDCWLWHPHADRMRGVCEISGEIREFGDPADFPCGDPPDPSLEERDFDQPPKKAD